MNLENFRTDQKLEEDGKWEDFGDGCKLLIARAGNKKWKDCWKKISKPYRKQIKRETISETKADELIIEAMAMAILLDWENLRDGKELIEYSKENAIKVLSIPDFREIVSEISQSMENYQNELDEEDKENL